MIPIREPLQCTLELTTGCNLCCMHCYRCQTKPDPDELSTSEVLRFFDYLEGIDVLELLLEGGEPFAHPNIFEIFASAIPRFAVSLTTNGTLIDGSMARRLAEQSSATHSSPSRDQHSTSGWRAASSAKSSAQPLAVFTTKPRQRHLESAVICSIIRMSVEV